MADCPTLAHAGAASSLAVLGQGPRPVPRGGPHPRDSRTAALETEVGLQRGGGASRRKRKEVIFPGSVCVETEGKERSSCAGAGQRRREDRTPRESRLEPEDCQGRAAPARARPRLSVRPLAGGPLGPGTAFSVDVRPHLSCSQSSPCVAHHGAQPPTPPPPAHLLPDRADRTGWTGKADSLCSHPAPLPLPDSAPPSPGPPR